MGFAGEALEIALGVAWVEGDGNGATERFGRPCVYADAVGDISLAEIGPYPTEEAALQDWAARKAAGKPVPNPYRTEQRDGQWFVVNTKYGPSLSHFQIRPLRDPLSGNAADRWRVAPKLVNADAPGAAVRYATQAAFAISKQGTDFMPWSAFKHNTYLLYLGKDFDLVTGHPRAGDWSK